MSNSQPPISGPPIPPPGSDSSHGASEDAQNDAQNNAGQNNAGQNDAGQNPDHNAPTEGFAPPAPAPGYAPPAPGYTPPAPANAAPGYTPPAAPGYTPPAAGGGYGAPSYSATTTTTGGPAAPKSGNGLAITSLILGGLAVLGAFIPFLNYVTGIGALAGLILGVIALMKKFGKRGLALAGTIVSTVGLLLSIILAVVYTIGFASAFEDDGFSSSSPAASDAPVAPSPTDEPSEAPADEESADGDDEGNGTRDNPAGIGTIVQSSTDGVPEWEISLGTPNLNANDIIAGENTFNDPPAEGFQYAMVPVTITYLGTETGSPFDIQVAFVSAAGTTHEEYDALAVAPNELSSINELYEGGTGTGNVVIAVPTADIENGTWKVTANYGDAYFFAAQ